MKTENERKNDARSGTCPVCGKEKKYIVRHLRSVHKWNELQFRSKGAKNEANPLRECPVRNCKAVLSSFKHHLINSHNIVDPSKRKELMLTLRKSKIPQELPIQTSKKNAEKEKMKTRGKAVVYHIETDTESDASQHSDNYQQPQSSDEGESDSDQEEVSLKETIKGKHRV